MDVDAIPSELVPPLAGGSVESVFEKAVDDLTGDVSPSHPSASDAFSAFSSVGSDEDRQLVVVQAPATLGVPANASAETLPTWGKVTFNPKFR